MLMSGKRKCCCLIRHLLLEYLFHFLALPLSCLPLGYESVCVCVCVCERERAVQYFVLRSIKDISFSFILYCLRRSLAEIGKKACTNSSLTCFMLLLASFSFSLSLSLILSWPSQKLC